MLKIVFVQDVILVDIRLFWPDMVDVDACFYITSWIWKEKRYQTSDERNDNLKSLTASYLSSHSTLSISKLRMVRNEQLIFIYCNSNKFDFAFLLISRSFEKPKLLIYNERILNKSVFGEILFQSTTSDEISIILRG